MKKTGKIKKLFIVLLILAAAAVVFTGIDFYRKVFTPFAGYGSGYGEPVIVNIKKGSSAAAIARLLDKNKIIAGDYYFRIYYRLFFNKTSFKSGEYRFDRPMTMREVIEKLAEGKVLLYKITIKEGLIIDEIARYLAGHPHIKIVAGDFLRPARSPQPVHSLDPAAPDLEGYLFPDTYLVRKDVTAAELVRLMVDKFKKNFTHAMKWRADELGLSIRQVVTLASLIERETAVREERFLISSVFHNRLRQRMLLDCDPTVIYALKRDDLYRGKLGYAELKYDSPYNTRLHKGLPPGPICNPGYASIEAALYPENTNYLYFVAKDQGSHYFSETLTEHNWAVRKYIINR
jgi:UPF0755 protein